MAADREDFELGGEEGEEDLGGDVAVADLGLESAGEAEAAAAAASSDDPFHILTKYHPDTVLRYAEVILPEVPLQQTPPSSKGERDPKHTSPPFLTVYERTKILGTRTNQLADGARPYITVPEYITAPLEIAKMELEARVLPFIIERPMPDGTFEYWRLSDLMIL
jgi:DNA-directed RNA polymerase subunit K/omega